MARKPYRYGQLSWPAKFAVYFLLIFCLLLFAFPVYWMIITALKHLPDVYDFPPKLFFFDIRWENFIEVFTLVPFANYMWNTIWYAAVSVFIMVLASALVAFGFARLRSKARAGLFAIVLATMMLPYQVTMIPQYLLFNQLGWTDSYLPLITPAVGGSAFLIFLLRQFFLGIPKELDEAVKIDGGGYSTIFFRIVLPLSVPALATAAILEFMSRWNDLIGPLIYVNSREKFLLTQGIASFMVPYGETPWHLLMMASFLAVVPPLTLFFFAQKYFIRGIVITGSKG